MEFEIKYLPGANYLSRFLILFPAPPQNLARGLLPKVAGNQTTTQQNHHMYVKWVQGKQQQIFPPVALKHRWMDTILILKLAQPCCNSQTRNKFFYWYASIFFRYSYNTL